jgi:putative ABC transport system substrate-binding protein
MADDMVGSGLAASMPRPGGNTTGVSILVQDFQSLRVELRSASPVLNNFHHPIVERLRDARLPAIYQWPEIAEDGGLLAYGPRILLCYRYIVSLVDKVLRGAKPADLPIEQPTKFELSVNLKTAGAIGMTIPPTLLLRADQVIE